MNESITDKIKNETIIIIQARLNSSRLQNKILLPFYKNVPVIDIIINRLKRNKFNVPIALATTNNPIDNELCEKFNNDTDIFVYRGDENDVLSRYIDCATHLNKKYIIRVCSDNPFISLEHIEQLCENFIVNNGLDYMTFTIDGKNPAVLSHIGVFSEIMTLKSLKKAYQNIIDKIFLEHVTNFMYSNTKLFNVKFIKFKSDFDYDIKDIRLTMDTHNDFLLLKELYKNIFDLHNDTLMPLNNTLAYIQNNKNIIPMMIKNILKNTK